MAKQVTKKAVVAKAPAKKTTTTVKVVKAVKSSPSIKSSYSPKQYSSDSAKFVNSAKRVREVDSLNKQYPAYGGRAKSEMDTMMAAGERILKNKKKLPKF